MKEIEELKQLVKSLAENLSAAKNQVLALKANQAESPDQPGNATKLSAGDTPENVTNMEVTISATPQGSIQDFYNGVSNSKKLQEYIRNYTSDQLLTI